MAGFRRLVEWLVQRMIADEGFMASRVASGVVSGVASGVRRGGLGDVDDALEAERLGDGQVGQHLAVQLDLGPAQLVDELRVHLGDGAGWKGGSAGR